MEIGFALTHSLVRTRCATLEGRHSWRWFQEQHACQHQLSSGFTILFLRCTAGKPTRHENRYGDHMQWRIQQKVCRHTCQSMYSFTQTTGPRICHFQFCSRPASQKHRRKSQGIVQDSLQGHGQLERELPPCSYSTNSDKSLIRNWTIQYMHRNNGAMFTEIFAYWNLQLNARIGIYY